MSLAEWVSSATLAAALASVASLGVVVWQLRVLGRQTEEGARQTRLSAEATRAGIRITLMQEMIKIDRFLCDRPELRTVLYGQSDAARGNLQSQQADALAEMIFDFSECLSQHENHFEGQIGDGWKSYFEDLASRSEVLQIFWRKNRRWYAEARRYFDPVMTRMAQAETATSSPAADHGGNHRPSRPQQPAGPVAAAPAVAPTAPDRAAAPLSAAESSAAPES
jgi:hypothetical protein